MKTIHDQTPGIRTRGAAPPDREASVADEPSPATAAPLWFPVVPLLIPGIAVLIVALTGVIWAALL